MSDPQVKAFHQTRLQFQLTEYTHRPIHGLAKSTRPTNCTVQANLVAKEAFRTAALLGDGVHLSRHL